MKEVYPDIFMITEKGFMGAMMPPVNIYVIAGTDGLIFDAGYGRKTALKYLGKELDRLKHYYKSQKKEFIITRVLPSHSHPDHFSGLQYLKNNHGLQIMLTQQMAERLSSKLTFYRGYIDKKNSMGPHPKLFEYLLIRYFQPILLGTTFIDRPDVIIQENSQIVINNESWQIMPAPGHCHDHISLYNPIRGVLFSGDNIMRTITTWLGPPHSNVKSYCETLEKILNLPKLELILSAHGSPIYEPRNRIKELLKHRKERTESVIDIIHKRGKRGVTAETIINKIYKRDEFQKRYIAGGWILLTLSDLEKKGKIRKEIKKKSVRYFHS